MLTYERKFIRKIDQLTAYWVQKHFRERSPEKKNVTNLITKINIIDYN